MAHLPAGDSPDERRALVAYTGPAELGIHLDWQGSNVAFTGRLMDELSRRGKAALAAFVASLPNTPQVQNSVERQQALAKLGARLNALEEAAFHAEFPVPALTGGEAAARPIDPAMLAASLVSEVLAPYYRLGAEGLRREAGASAVGLAERVANKLEPALAGDLAAGALLNIFRQNPELGQPGLLGVLKARLAADPALAGQLAATLSAAEAEPGDGGLRSLVEVSQRIGLVSGDVVGAIVGADVVDKIRKLSVEQNVETVGPGATLTGAVIGGSGPVNVGGQHHHGDRIDTGGAPYFGGNVQVGRDLVGRDQVVQGDQVGGDRITMGDISNAQVAAGRGAHVEVSQGLGGAELAATFQAVLDRIDRRPPDPNVEKEEIRDTVGKVKDEVAKGDAVNVAKVERWLRQLIDLAPDVADVALKGLANPVMGVAAAVAAVARRLRPRTD
ncbi:MAG: hypothetical protein EHM56_08060 [Chloroflexi bacterium]|nr:MAG: hypothetical protein EHM56_08060 [Chloroflexota bacterium]